MKDDKKEFLEDALSILSRQKKKFLERDALKYQITFLHRLNTIQEPQALVKFLSDEVANTVGATCCSAAILPTSSPGFTSWTAGRGFWAAAEPTARLHQQIRELTCESSTVYRITEASPNSPMVTLPIQCRSALLAVARLAGPHRGEPLMAAGWLVYFVLGTEHSVFEDEQYELVDEIWPDIQSAAQRALILESSQTSLVEALFKSEQLNKLNTIGRALASMDKIEDLLTLILDLVIESTGAERGFLMLMNQVGELTFEIARNMDKTELSGSSFKVSKSITHKVAASGQTIFVVDALHDQRTLAHSSISDLQLRSILCVPLKIKDRIIGVFYVDSRNIGEEHQPEKLQFYEALAGQAAVAIENARLHEEKRHNDWFALIGQISGTFIHDLKGPMTNIKGYAQLIEGLATEPRITEFSEAIYKEVNRMLTMTREILEFARSENNLQKIAVRCSRLLNDIVAVLTKRSDVIDKGIAITLLCPDDPLLEVDLESFYRIFENLTANSVEAIERPKGSITIATRLSGPMLAIDFTDNGRGISDRLMRRVFEPFFSRAKSKGTGLGLTIVKKIVQSHGGSIALESAEEQGTTVRILIPVARPGSGAEAGLPS